MVGTLNSVFRYTLYLSKYRNCVMMFNWTPESITAPGTRHGCAMYVWLTIGLLIIKFKNMYLARVKAQSYNNNIYFCHGNGSLPGQVNQVHYGGDHVSCDGATIGHAKTLLAGHAPVYKCSRVVNIIKRSLITTDLYSVFNNWRHKTVLPKTPLIKQLLAGWRERQLKA